MNHHNRWSGMGAGIALGGMLAACGGTASHLDREDVGRAEAAICEDAVITAPTNVTAQACGLNARILTLTRPHAAGSVSGGP